MRPFFSRFANYLHEKVLRTGFGGELEKQKKEFHRFVGSIFLILPEARRSQGFCNGFTLRATKEFPRLDPKTFGRKSG